MEHGKNLGCCIIQIDYSLQNDQEQMTLEWKKINTIIPNSKNQNRLQNRPHSQRDDSKWTSYIKMQCMLQLITPLKSVAHQIAIPQKWILQQNGIV